MAIIKPIIAILVVLALSAGIILAGNQGSLTVTGFPLFALCASVGFLLHWVAFVPAFLFQTEHYFDLTGSVSYIAAVFLAATFHPALDDRGILLCVLIAIWAARLGSFLFIRVKRAGQDRRFTEIKKRFFRFLFTWTLGGAWVFITMAAGLAAISSTTQRPLGVLAILGLILWLAGFVIEVMADSQKTKFRRDPANADSFISTGLWYYSRHPNYFGEIVLWLGVALIALPVLSGWQYVTLISPLFVTLLLTRVSGIPLLEASAEKRWGSDPAYQSYVASTSVLIPLPRK